MQNMSQTFCLRRTASSHHCLTHQSFPLTKAMVTLALMLQEILQDLTRRQLPHGGWSYHLASRQASLEPTCLSLLALRSNESEAENRGLRFVIIMQNPNGSWPAFEGDDREGSWTTSLALWALQGKAVHTSVIDRGQRWCFSSKVVSPTGCGSGNFVRPTGTFVSILTSSVGHGCLRPTAGLCLLRFPCSPSNNGFHLMGLHKPTSGSSLVSRCCSIAFAQAEGGMPATASSTECHLHHILTLLRLPWLPSLLRH